jgi:hypothetical protein
MQGTMNEGAPDVFSIVERDTTEEGVQATVVVDGQVAELPRISPELHQRIGRMLGLKSPEVRGEAENE